MIRSIAGFIWAVGIPLAAQTQVDLRTQSKSIDFKAAQATSPFKTGAALPPTCSRGDLFFLTGVAAGANVYGCSTDNNWSLEAGGGGGVLQVENNGTLVGARAIVDLSTGQGVFWAISDTGQTIAIQTSIDTSYVQTKGAAQSGASLLCAPASASGTAYSCALSPALTAYTSGMILYWKPDVDATGGSTTLNVDTLGPVAVKMANGTSDPAPGELLAGRILEIWYDGAAFRLLQPAIPAGILGETRPGCAVAVRGRLWFVAGAATVKDGLSVCAKDAADAYAWRTLY